MRDKRGMMVTGIRILAAAAGLAAAISLAQQATPGTKAPDSQSTQNPQQGTPAAPPPRVARGPGGSRAFLGLGVPPDVEAAKRGAPIFASNCAFCHGPTARGAEGPSLLTSDAVLADDHGEKLVPFLHQGRPSKGMPAFTQLEDTQLTDVTEFLHLQVENYANRGSYQVADILVGDPAKGKTYFDSKCSGCHSVSGDLAHVGTKFKPLDLQRRWISPERNSPARAMTASVTTPAGIVSGTLTRIDDFQVAITDAAGHTLDFERVPSVQVQLKDPLAFHMTMIPTLKDDDIHNVTAYLEKQK